MGSAKVKVGLGHPDRRCAAQGVTTEAVASPHGEPPADRLPGLRYAKLGPIPGGATMRMLMALGPVDAPLPAPAIEDIPIGRRQA